MELKKSKLRGNIGHRIRVTGPIRHCFIRAAVSNNRMTKEKTRDNPPQTAAVRIFPLPFSKTVRRSLEKCLFYSKHGITFIPKIFQMFSLLLTEKYISLLPIKKFSE